MKKIISVFILMIFSFAPVFAKEKIEMIFSSMTEEENFWSYVFPILRYHSRIFELTEEDFTDGSISLAAILVRCGLCPSNSDAKRNIKQGGISVNDEKITDFAKSYSKADIGGEFIIKKGKKDYRKVTVK